MIKWSNVRIYVVVAAFITMLLCLSSLALDSEMSDADDIPVTGVNLDKTSITFEDTTTSVQLIATVIPADATNKTVFWSSDKPSVVSVSDTGLVKPVSNGTAKVYVTTQDGHFESYCTVTVDIKVTGVELDRTSMSFSDTDTTVKLTATVIPSNAKNKNVTWSSEDPKVAEVDDTGTVRAKGNGSTRICVTTQDGGYKKYCDVTVDIKVTGVVLDRSKITIDEESYEQLTATVIPSNAKNKNVTWSSDDESAVTVDETGRCHAHAGGKATITVVTEDGGYEATCEVTVAEIPRGYYSFYDGKNLVKQIELYKSTTYVTLPEYEDIIGWKSNENNAGVSYGVGEALKIDDKYTSRSFYTGYAVYSDALMMPDNGDYSNEEIARLSTIAEQLTSEYDIYLKLEEGKGISGSAISDFLDAGGKIELFSDGNYDENNVKRTIIRIVIQDISPVPDDSLFIVTSDDDGFTKWDWSVDRWLLDEFSRTLYFNEKTTDQELNAITYLDNIYLVVLQEYMMSDRMVKVNGTLAEHIQDDDVLMVELTGSGTVSIMKKNIPLIGYLFIVAGAAFLLLTLHTLRSVRKTSKNEGGTS